MFLFIFQLNKKLNRNSTKVENIFQNEYRSHNFMIFKVYDSLL